MPCPTGETRETCQQNASTGVVQPPLSLDEIPDKDSDAYFNAVAEALVAGRISLEEAHKRVKDYSLMTTLFYQLVDEVVANPPKSMRRADGELMSFGEFLANRMMLPAAAWLDIEKGELWAKHCGWYYEKQIADLLKKGEATFEEAFLRLRPDAARKAMYHAIQSRMLEMGLADFIRAARPYTYSPTYIMARDVHRKAVKDALKNGLPVSDAALGSYPDLSISLRPRPGSIPREEWLQREIERLNRPLVEEGMDVVAYYPKHKRNFATRDKYQAEKVLNQARKKQPEFTWEMVEYYVGDEREYEVIGRRPARPDEIAGEAQAITGYHQEIEKLLAAGEEVPVELLLEFPDLVAKYGL